MKWLPLLALLSGLCITGPIHADALLSADEDSVVVHHLAHFGAGTLVAIVPDFILTRFDADSWKRAWYTRLAVDCLSAALVTDLYEAETDKDTATRLGHDLDGALGAVVLVGASVHWTFR